MLFAYGPRLFNQKSESDVRKKTINAGQILGIMGEAKNGLYTKHLLKSLETPGLPVEQVLSPVLRGVEQETYSKPSPWASSSSSGDFYFVVESQCPFLILSRSSLTFLSGSIASYGLSQNLALNPNWAIPVSSSLLLW